MLAACQAGGDPSGLASDGLTLAAVDKVWICHFPGHEEKGEGAFTDFVTTEPSGDVSLCFGANAIEVSRAACANGHGIDAASCGL